MAAAEIAGRADRKILDESPQRARFPESRFRGQHVIGDGGELPA